MLFVNFNNLRRIICTMIFALGILRVGAVSGASWQDQVSPLKPGDFPALTTPFRATYRIGWGSITAARAEMVIKRPQADTYEFRANTATVGTARSLWPMDATIVSTVNASRFRPIRLDQTEERSDRTLRESVQFDPNGAERIRTVTPKSGGAAPRTENKRFDSPALQDFMSTFLLLRSQSLANGETKTVAVMSPSVPYLMTMTVRGREEIGTQAGRFRAIRLSVDSIQRVKDDGTLMPHKRFRSATIWISDDATRQILRVQSQVFVGSVFLELESVAPAATGR